MKNILVACVLLGACSSDNSVDSNEQARRAFLGLNESISKALTLGFTGYDAATSANIPAEMANGDAAGTLTVTGKVDQGNPDQATMDLSTGLVKYSDGKFAIDDKGHTISVTYRTSTDVTMQPALSLKLNASAGDSLSGALMGDYTMTGDLGGTITLDVSLAGTFSGAGTNVERVVGSTTVTGTAVNASGGMYTIDAML